MMQSLKLFSQRERNKRGRPFAVRKETNVKRIRRQHLTHIVIMQNEVARQHHDHTDTVAVIYLRYRVTVICSINQMDQIKGKAGKAISKVTPSNYKNVYI